MQKEGHMTSAYAVLKLLANVILQCAVCIFTFVVYISYTWKYKK